MAKPRNWATLTNHCQCNFNGLYWKLGYLRPIHLGFRGACAAVWQICFAQILWIVARNTMSPLLFQCPYLVSFLSLIISRSPSFSGQTNKQTNKQTSKQTHTQQINIPAASHLVPVLPGGHVQVLEAMLQVPPDWHPGEHPSPNGQVHMNRRKNIKMICNTIKGNESLVENSNFYFLTPLSQNYKMLHFDANPIT